MSANIKKIIEYINLCPDNSIIIIDCFDALISRHISPNYKKKLWAKEIANYLFMNYKINDIYNLRLELEYHYKYEKQNNRFYSGIDFTNICEDMATIFLNKYDCNSDLLTLKNLFIKTEINTECRVTYLNKDVLDLINYINSRNMTLILVADFNLPKQYLNKILKFHRIDKSFNDIYTSCDSSLEKFLKNIYFAVNKKNNIEYKYLIMIGDNKTLHHEAFDGLKLKKFCIDRREKYDFYEQFNYKYKLNNVVVNNNTTIQIMQKENKIENFAITLYAFIDLLYSNLLRANAKKVYFLSRDGKYLKRLFDIYRKKQNYKNEQFIESYYMIVSRKSTYIASLNELKNEKFEMFNNTYESISIVEFLKMLDFTDNEISIIEAKMLEIDFNREINKFFESQIFEKLKSLKEFACVYENKRTISKKNLKCYLEKFNIKEGDVMNIVDSGWHGTIQDNIYKLFGGKSEIKGYYIGYYYSTKMVHKSNNKKSGILISYNTDTQRDDNRDSFLYGTAIPKNMEMLLHSEEGSVLRYLSNGSVILNEEKCEKEMYCRFIKPLQEKMMISFGEILDDFKLSTISYSDYKQKVLGIHLNMEKYLGKGSVYFKNCHSKNNFTE